MTKPDPSHLESGPAVPGGRRRSLIAVVAGCVTLSAALTGCGQHTTDGQPSAEVSIAATSPAASPTTTPPTPSSSTVTSASSTAAATVTVTDLPAPRPRRRTVTHVVHVPERTAPGSSAALGQLLQEADAVNTSEYYDGDALFFDSPSQNIGCYLYDDYVTCAITDYDFPQPGPDCDAGIGAIVDSDGSPSLTDCSGYFHVANEGAVLPYGDEIVDGDFACVSESNGISCADTDTDTGFTLSRQTYSPVY